MIEDLYFAIKEIVENSFVRTIPYLRRFLRFCALPYCFIHSINWRICPRPRFLAALDLLYIFFFLRYYPENYSLCRLWEKDRSTWKNYYGSIYDAYQRGRLRKEVQKKEYEILFEDKNVCYQLCKAGGFALPKQYACLYPHDDFRSIINEILINDTSIELIVKPVSGKGGKGAFLINYDKNNSDIIVCDTRGNQFSLDNFHLSTYSVLQERVKQHPALSNISPSTNTFRIVTMIKKNGDILVLGTRIRFGRAKSFVDNTSSGGIGVGIYPDTGILMCEGYDSNGESYLSHPSSGVLFEGLQIPEWQNIIQFAKKIQLFFPYYRMLGHDIALSENGPVVIEINAAHDNIMLEQNCGPILARDETRQAFEEYGLLIN